jgi:N-acetylmuramoyl-L-alanine amidase
MWTVCENNGMFMNKIWDNILATIFVATFILIVPATYAYVNVTMRPDTITVKLELPPPGKPVLIVYDVIDPEPGKLLDPPSDFPIYWEWKSSGIEDFTTYIDIRDNNPEMLEYFNVDPREYNTHVNHRPYTAEEKACMAQNIYFEARNESLKGMIAVALVTLERVQDPRYPSDVCGVVYDNKQFSWYWDGLPDRPRNMPKYAEIVLIVDAVMDTETALYDFTYDSTHYHADYVDPYWNEYMVFKAKIDTHIFYREEPKKFASL